MSRAQARPFGSYVSISCCANDRTQNLIMLSMRQFALAELLRYLTSDAPQRKISTAKPFERLT
jgi:hypothetical protein